MGKPLENVARLIGRWTVPDNAAFAARPLLSWRRAVCYSRHPLADRKGPVVS